MYKPQIDADDSAAVAEALARVATGEKTVPGEVVAAIARGKHPVAAWRAYRKRNQSELGKRAKLNPAHISQIENGTRNASVPTLVALGKALDVPWNWLSRAKQATTPPITRRIFETRPWTGPRVRPNSPRGSRFQPAFGELQAENPCP